MKLIKKIEMECINDDSCKMWVGHLFDNGLVVTEWSRIGADTTQSKSFPNAGADFLEKKVAEKIKKGYQVV